MFKEEEKWNGQERDWGKGKKEEEDTEEKQNSPRPPLLCAPRGLAQGLTQSRVNK